VQFHNSPMQVAHTAAHVSHTRSDDLFVCRQASGQVIIEQDAREVLLDVGPSRWLIHCCPTKQSS
jgi:hypothetical protein